MINGLSRLSAESRTKSIVCHTKHDLSQSGEPAAKIADDMQFESPSGFE
jgi:hypothetical protein